MLFALSVSLLTHVLHRSQIFSCVENIIHQVQIMVYLAKILPVAEAKS